MFADLFIIRREELESLGGVKGEHFIVYCLDVSVFVHRIALRRGMTSDHFRVKFGGDYGQSFLKVTLTLTYASWWQEDDAVSCLSSPRNLLKLKGINHPLECTRRFGVWLRL